MNEKHYVIHFKIGETGKWNPLAHKYPTLDAAREALKQKREYSCPATKYRIAESYTVVRYKPVKE